MKKILINSKKEMGDLARKIAASAQVGDVIGLKGTLGCGKTFFAKNFINSLQENPSEILSPTFNLVYSYDSKKGEIFHFDLYRLKSAEELENIGFVDALKNGICLIEWPEIAQEFLQKNYLEIEIKIVGESEAREITLFEKEGGIAQSAMTGDFTNTDSEPVEPKSSGLAFARPPKTTVWGRFFPFSKEVT